MDNREEIGSRHIEEWTSSECCRESCEERGHVRKNEIGYRESDTCCEGEYSEKNDLSRLSELTFAKYRSKREWDGNLVNSDSYEDRVSDFWWYTEPRSYPESVEKRMDKNRDPRYQRDMIVVLMWIFVRVVTMSVIVRMRSEDLFYEIDEEKSRDKCINRKLSLFERLRKDMDDCYREHRTRTESDEEVQDASTDSLPYIEKESRSWDEREDEEGSEHG